MEGIAPLGPVCCPMAPSGFRWGGVFLFRFFGFSFITVSCSIRVDPSCRMFVINRSTTSSILCAQWADRGEVAGRILSPLHNVHIGSIPGAGLRHLRQVLLRQKKQA